MVAVLDSVGVDMDLDSDSDSDTAREIKYAYAQGLPVYGLRVDFRMLGIEEGIEFDDRAICGAVYGSGGAAGAVGEGLGECGG